MSSPRSGALNLKSLALIGWCDVTRLFQRVASTLCPDLRWCGLRFTLCCKRDLYRGGTTGCSGSKWSGLHDAEQSLAGISVRRHVFAPQAGQSDSDKFLRYVDELTNRGNVPVTVMVRIGSVGDEPQLSDGAERIGRPVLTIPPSRHQIVGWRLMMGRSTEGYRQQVFLSRCRKSGFCKRTESYPTILGMLLRCLGTFVILQFSRLRPFES